jgi:hypothetical protein
MPSQMSDSASAPKKELGVLHRGSGATHLLRRDVDPRNPEASCKALCIWHAGTAAQLEHARPVLQP